MKTPQELEDREIGELIREIDSERFNLEIDVDDEGATRRVAVTISQREISADQVGTYLDQLTFDGDSLAEALSLAVNSIRRQQGKPTLEEEAEAMVAKAIAATPPSIMFGEGAACSCGNRVLSLYRNLEHLVRLNRNGLCSPPSYEQQIKAGEILTCPECGATYSFAPGS